MCVGGGVCFCFFWPCVKSKKSATQPNLQQKHTNPITQTKPPLPKKTKEGGESETFPKRGETATTPIPHTPNKGECEKESNCVVPQKRERNPFDVKVGGKLFKNLQEKV